MSQLLQSLVNGYKKKGWIVCTDYMMGYENIPSTWSGPKPDLIAGHGNEIVAVSIEDAATLSNSRIADKWRDMIEENNARLVLVVKEKDLQKRAKKIAKINNVEVTIRQVKRSYRKNVKSGSDIFHQGSKVDWLIVFTVVVVFLAFIVLFLPNILAYFKLKEFYQPFDSERQQEYLKKREKEDRGKSAEEIRDRNLKDRDRFKKQKERLEKIHGK